MVATTRSLANSIKAGHEMWRVLRTVVPLRRVAADNIPIANARALFAALLSDLQRVFIELAAIKKLATFTAEATAVSFVIC